MRFFIDEMSLATELAAITPDLAKIASVVDSIEQVLDAPSCTVIVAENFYELPFGTGMMSDLLFNEEYSNRRDLILRLQLAIDEAEKAEQAIIDNGVRQLKSEGKGGLLSTTDHEIACWWNSGTMGLIKESSQVPPVLRMLFVVYGLAEEFLERLAEKMFPQIYFHVFPTCKKLKIDSRTGVAQIIEHLAWLNDDAAVAFSTRFQEVIFLAGAKGVEISPESPNTRSDAAAMKERQIEIAGKTLVCEWHTKFEKTHGRLHFQAFPNRPNEVHEAVGTKVIVGIATDHLK